MQQHILQCTLLVDFPLTTNKLQSIVSLNFPNTAYDPPSCHTKTRHLPSSTTCQCCHLRTYPVCPVMMVSLPTPVTRPPTGSHFHHYGLMYLLTEPRQQALFTHQTLGRRMRLQAADQSYPLSRK